MHVVALSLSHTVESLMVNAHLPITTMSHGVRLKQILAETTLQKNGNTALTALRIVTAKWTFLTLAMT